ncbi:hypothetical protein ACFPRL_06170 [Pseudoclavibacter helvolus]
MAIDGHRRLAEGIARRRMRRSSADGRSWIRVMRVPPPRAARSCARSRRTRRARACG